ncbi:MAG TPA: CPBP family intramembrane glutamic endopeptidase [Candidatus Dormibacteraeota bacterium]|nr:CPBP family intramembrane glutamic endopeptidase [Candidatus Dormibacteraeota bacterium]
MSNVISEPAGPDSPSLEPAAAEVRWSPWLGVIFLIVDYFGSQFAAGLLVSLYPFARHWSHAQSLDWLNNSVGAQFAYILMAEVLAVGVIYSFLRLYGLNLGSIGLKRPRWRDPAYGLAAAPFYFLLFLLSVGVISHFVPGLNVNQTQQLGFNNVTGPGQMVMAFVSLVILPPLAEEIMVRGFLYSSLKKALPTLWAVLATSGIFAAAHLPEGGSAGPLYIAALDTFVLSLVLIYLREKTGSLWASITLHAIKNGVAFAALFAFHLR